MRHFLVSVPLTGTLCLTKSNDPLICLSSSLSLSFDFPLLQRQDLFRTTFCSINVGKVGGPLKTSEAKYRMLITVHNTPALHQGSIQVGTFPTPCLCWIRTVITCCTLYSYLPSTQVYSCLFFHQPCVGHSCVNHHYRRHFSLVSKHFHKQSSHTLSAVPISSARKVQLTGVSVFAFECTDEAGFFDRQNSHSEESIVRRLNFSVC